MAALVRPGKHNCRGLVSSAHVQHARCKERQAQPATIDGPKLPDCGNPFPGFLRTALGIDFQPLCARSTCSRRRVMRQTMMISQTTRPRYVHFILIGSLHDTGQRRRTRRESLNSAKTVPELRKSGPRISIRNCSRWQAKARGNSLRSVCRS
jgi:hypothetical protein